ncbi:MAG TPA: hypothetical protein VGC81_12590 [Candidatus Methylomirabilis sp.]
MNTELQTISDTWKALQPFLSVDKCLDCECLQAGLTETVMALEALPAEPERDQLLTTIRRALDLSKTHGCLGCDPCEPADILVSFYQARDAASEDERCCCGPSCADESSVARGIPEKR